MHKHHVHAGPVLGMNCAAQIICAQLLHQQVGCASGTALACFDNHQRPRKGKAMPSAGSEGREYLQCSSFDGTMEMFGASKQLGESARKLWPARVAGLQPNPNSLSDESDHKQHLSPHTEY